MIDGLVFRVVVGDALVGFPIVGVDGGRVVSRVLFQESIVRGVVQRADDLNR